MKLFEHPDFEQAIIRAAEYFRPRGLVLRPLIDGEMSRFMGWIGGTHTMRYHAHYHTSGLGHVDQQRYKSFPIQDDDHFFVVCRYVERNALLAKLVDRAEDWRWGSLWRWQQKPEPDPKLMSPWPLPRLPKWVERVNDPLTKKELDAVRLSAQRGRPLGDLSGWNQSPHASTLNQPYVRADGHKCDQKWICQSKRIDTFDTFLFGSHP